MNADVEFELEVEVTREAYRWALLDGARALVVQNARFSRRGDPFSRWRTPQFQRRVRTVGLAATVVGTLASLLLLLLDVAQGVAMPGISLGFLVTFALLGALFWNIERVLGAGLRLINVILERRAARMLAQVGRRVPATVGYRLVDGEIHGQWRENGEPLASWSRPLTDQPYALVGEATVAVFKHAKALSPSFFCFFSSPDELAKLREVLSDHGVTFEILAPTLMPESAVPRPWPQL